MKNKKEDNKEKECHYCQSTLHEEDSFGVCYRTKCQRQLDYDLRQARCETVY